MSQRAHEILQRIHSLIGKSGFHIGISTMLIEFGARVICRVDDPEKQAFLLQFLSNSFLPVWNSHLIISVCSKSEFMSSMLDGGNDILTEELGYQIDARVLVRSLLNCTLSFLTVLYSSQVPRQNPSLVFNFVTFQISQKLIDQILHFGFIVSQEFKTSSLLNSPQEWENAFRTEEGDYSSAASSGLNDMVNNRFEQPASRRRWIFHVRQKIHEIIGYCMKDVLFFHRLAEQPEFLSLFISSVFSDSEQIHPYLLSSIASCIMPEFCKNCPILYFSNLLKPILCSFIQASTQNLSKQWTCPLEDVFSSNSLNECCTAFSDLLTTLVFFEPTSSDEQAKPQNPYLQMICVHNDLLSLFVLSSVKLLYWPVHNSRVKASRILIKLIQILSESSLIQSLCSSICESSLEILSLTSKTVEPEIVRCISSVLHECFSRFQAFPEQMLLRYTSTSKISEFRKGFNMQDRSITAGFLRLNVLGLNNALGSSAVSVQDYARLPPKVSGSESSKLLQVNLQEDSLESLSTIFT
jgi:hypothetical protein